jgi:hypothetical protein
VKFLRKFKAKKLDVPFQIKSFWPPYYISFKHDFHGLKVLNDIYSHHQSDGPVAVAEGNGQRHFYLIKGFYPGNPWGDHIVSPKQWDLEYHHSELIIQTQHGSES